MRKRLLSMLLGMCMMMSLLPVSALAADDGGRPSASEWFNSNKRQPEDGLDEDEVETSASDGVELVPVTAPETSETVKSAPVVQSNQPTSGQCGDNAYWELSADGVLTISGSGDIWDYGYFDSPFYHNENIQKVVINEGITSIGNKTFSSCGSNLTNVSIPNGLIGIGDEAFEYCDGLIAITIPDSVRFIGEYAFYGCSNLSQVFLSKNLMSIANSTFNSCSSLTNIIIPDAVLSIGECAFYCCDGLTDITFSNNINTIGQYAFYNCSMLSDVVIPNSVKTIEEGAFEECSGLKTASILGPITCISEDTFDGCSNLESIWLPNSVSKIENFAFGLCSKLKNVYYAGSQEQWNSIDIDRNSYRVLGGERKSDEGKSENSNEQIDKALIHFESTGGMSNDVQTLSGTVEYLAGWDEGNRRVYFGSSNGIGYSVDVSVAESDVNSINQLVGKYVLVDIDSKQATTITSIKPVESKIGTCSTVGKDVMTIDGVNYPYPARGGLVLDTYAGKDVLYHLIEGNIVAVSILNTKKGKLTKWDDKTQQVIINDVGYYLNALSGVRDVNQFIGHEIVFSTIDSTSDRPLLNAKIYIPESTAIQFTTSITGNSVVIGTEFDLYIGYYLDNQLDTNTKDFNLTITNGEVASVTDEGWDDFNGRHYKITAHKKGETIFSTTVNGETKDFKLYVFDTNMVFTIDTIPEMSIEKGKTTNFYNYSGLVVDNFTSQPIKDHNGNIISYKVNMTVYNTHNTYAAVSAYDSEGVLKNYSIIDRKPALQTNFVDTVKELSHQIGDIFHWLGNHKYYSGESISKASPVEIEVPAGGHLWISNNPTTSEVVMLANNIAIITDALMMVYKISKNAGDLADIESEIIYKNIGTIIKSIGLETIKKSSEYIDDELPDFLKDAAGETMESGEWDFNSMADYFNGMLKRYSDFGPNIIKKIEDDLCSLTGISKMAESAALDVIPTGTIINFLYSLNDGGNFISFFIVQLNSANFPKGIYIDAPKKINETSSNYDTVLNKSDSFNQARRSSSHNINNTVNKEQKSNSMSVESTNKTSSETGGTTNSFKSKSNPFIDINENAWYYSAVCYVNENDLMTGVENRETFAPSANLSRAMLAQILYNKEKNPEVAKKSGFEDVPSGAWYENAITWAAEEGIVSGYEDGRFAPNDPVTREQFAVMLWRYSGSPSASTENLTFNDIAAVRSYALEAMAWAVSNNIISGYEGNWLAPGEYASRVQVAQMLKNYLDK